MRKTCIFILSFVLVFTGCLPTPTEEAVIHKNEGTLEQQLAATAAPAYRVEVPAVTAEASQANAPAGTGNPESPEPRQNGLRLTLGAPERVQDSFDGQAVGDRLYIQMDAAVEVPNVERVPVLRGRVGYAPEQAAERITKLLLGDGPYLLPGHSERAYNQLFMEYYQKWIEALDEKPYGPAADYDRIRENLQQNFDANAESAQPALDRQLFRRHRGRHQHQQRGAKLRHGCRQHPLLLQRGQPPLPLRLDGLPPGTSG